eukprot:TRINITY_DN1206_c1_g4_i1.p1 TRINITY_DN1206_c1_g4~~TRINITY_DN1206_c1_g4_i1.p1  ORF type:complete len:484 (+),score=101.02 TRINITY_DN1206_c1_g4_i1:154-1605(+)
MSRKQLKAALDLVRRMPPARQTRTLSSLLALIPQEEFAEELLADVDQPLRVRLCEETGKEFIYCEFNRDGDSFRSPWNNKYYPEFDGFRSSNELRKLEIEMNSIFELYTKQYFGSEALQSCYLWDTGDVDGWAAAILIRKDIKGVGTWNSMHIINVQEYPSDDLACYEMTTSVMLRLNDKDKTDGRFSFKMAGNIAKRWKQYDAFVGSKSDHILNIGNYVQHYENKIRGNLPEIYFGKAQQVTSEVRSLRVEEQVHMLSMQAKPRRKKIWRSYADENNEKYWYNTVTGESQWEEPENKDERRKEKKSKKDKKSKKSKKEESQVEEQKASQGPLMGQIAAAAAAKIHKDPAPATEEAQPVKEKTKKIWKKVKADPPYWYNTITQETSWDPPPTESKPAESAGSASASPKSATSTAAPPSSESSVQEIIAWMASLSLGNDYSKCLTENAIDGAVLTSLSESDLPSIGITAFGDKRKIAMAMGWGK